MYEKYRELSWDLHNSVTSDRVIVNNSRRYFIKASLYRRWSSPTNRTICKHCNICRRLQPRPSISATVSQISPPDFSRNIFDFALSSLYSHSSTARNQSSWWKCPNHCSPILSFRQISFSSRIFCTINPSLLDYCNWTLIETYRDKNKKKFLLWFTAWTSYDSLCDFFQKYSTHSRLQFHFKNTYSDSQ